MHAFRYIVLEWRCTPPERPGPIYLYNKKTLTWWLIIAIFFPHEEIQGVPPPQELVSCMQVQAWYLPIPIYASEDRRVCEPRPHFGGWWPSTSCWAAARLIGLCRRKEAPSNHVKAASLPRRDTSSIPEYSEDLPCFCLALPSILEGKITVVATSSGY